MIFIIIAQNGELFQNNKASESMKESQQTLNLAGLNQETKDDNTLQIQTPKTDSCTEERQSSQ